MHSYKMKRVKQYYLVLSTLRDKTTYNIATVFQYTYGCFILTEITSTDFVLPGFACIKC